MSKGNPLLGLIGYGDSDDESDDGIRQNTISDKSRSVGMAATNAQTTAVASAAIHPAPIAHCPWSACYDETSGFTYYWNQQTNAVTWEAPPEYLLALKLAQQHLHTSGSAEVSAEEWQLYQQALAEKQNSQNKAIAKTSIKSVKKTDKNSQTKENKQKHLKNKRPYTEDDDDEKIELITSYHNSDSESNDDTDSPAKPIKSAKSITPTPSIPIEPQKPISKPNPHKKLKTKPQVIEYGPSLPPNQNYTFPIGPELPIESVENNTTSEKKPASPKLKNTAEDTNIKSNKDAKQNDIEDIQDEQQLFKKLKDKAQLLEKLGGEIPKELQKMIEDGSSVENITPKKEETKTMTDNIDDLLEEIEKKELPRVKSKKIDMFSDTNKLKDDLIESPKSDRDKTPPLEAKPLFPSIKSIDEAKSLETNSPRPSPQPSPPPATEKDMDKKAEAIDKKGVNLYLPDASERLEKVNKKKLRISNSVLPDRKKNEEVAYTTKYSQFIEGFSDERTGLGFSKDEDSVDSTKTSTVNYGNGLVFTKGETLNEDKKDDDLDDLTDLVEAKLKYLTQLQPCVVTPVQEMLIQMQTLAGAFRAGAVGGRYWARWARRAAGELRAHERRAAPPGWSAAFQRSEGRYCYRRESDGFVQWEYPAVASTDMDISTTPPHPGIENKEDAVPPPLPASPPVPPPPPPSAPASASGRVRTPPPPSWADPPPPGCDDLPPLPPAEAKQEIGDELASFYSDIAELEKQVTPNSASSSPPTTPPPPPSFDREDKRERESERPKDGKVNKKKPKVKLLTSMGLKHKSVSTLVAKWQQVAEEINSD